MESGDHTHAHKFLSSPVEDSKQHAGLGMMENLHKSEQHGFTGDQHVVHPSEDLLFGDGMRKDKKLPSTTDINQFILHESRTNVHTEDVPVSTSTGQSSEASETETTHRDNASSVEIGSKERHPLLTDPEAEDSGKINLQTDPDLLVHKESAVIDKTDTEDTHTNDKSVPNETVEIIHEDRLSDNQQSHVEGESLGLRSEVTTENANVKGSSEDSSNSFLFNERSETQTKTESDKTSETETHKQFFSHEGNKNFDERNEQSGPEENYPVIKIEKPSPVEDKKETESLEVLEKTPLGEDQSMSEKQEEKFGNVDQKVSELTESKEESEDEWLDILGSGHLKKKIIKKAENDYRPQNLHICEINLEGCLEDGTVVEKSENLKIQVGDMEVIQGIDLALPLMNVGEVALLEVSPRFAYGSLGRLPEIPPNAKIMYTIELLSAEDEPELESLSIAQRKEIGDKKRERGNYWFARQEYSFAIQSYRRAIEFLDEAEGGFSIEKKDISEDAEKQLQELLEDRLKVFNNLAAAQMKIKAYDAALTSVENVLRCQPQNVKALFRKGKILSAKGDTTGALSILRTASQLEPDSKVIKLEVQRLLDVIKHDTKQEKSLYKKMLGQNKSAEKTSSKGSKISYRTWGILCSSVAVVLLGAVAYRYKFL